MTATSNQVYSQSGLAYFIRGFDLITTKGLKRFVIIPILVNLILFGVALGYLINNSGAWMAQLMSYLPSYFQWLEFILYPLLFLVVILSFGLLFNTITNFIAAPFNGMLAEKVERHLSGESLGDEGLLSLLKDIPRTLGRELQKLMYYLPRLLLFFIALLLLPGIGQVLWLAFGAWMMAIQYLDYPFDNHKISFAQMRRELGAQKGKSFGFGIMVALVTMLPLVNFVVMPIAVCGATALWVDHFRAGVLHRAGRVSPTS